jgi:ubiquinone/menaquinone biosynthesis C-methylase UbiE
VIEPARSFERAAEEYDRGRPAWPEAVLDAVPVEPGATVLDLGAGTGKLTETLARRFDRVVAVEPLAAMRAYLERRVPAAEALDGRAEAIPLPDASVDAVFAGQSFHWFATDAAVGEIARVLRPGGVLALLWNTPNEERPSPLPDAYRERLNELHDSVPPPASVSWIAHRPDDERARILAELAELLPPGEYVFPIRAEITWARRR